MSGSHRAFIASALMLWGAGSFGSTSLPEILARLPVLDGAIPAYHIAGARERAPRVQRLFEGAADDYARRLGAAPAVAIALVGPEEWRSLNARPQPYGAFMPSVLPGIPHLVSIPTGRGHALDVLIHGLMRDSEAVRALGLGVEELGDRFTELSALHEIGHFYARQAFGSPPAWLSEFVASYLAYAFLAAQHAEAARIWEVVCAASVEHVRPSSHVSGDFHVGRMADNYLVYLGRLQARVGEVHGRYGAEFLHALRSAWRQRADAQDAAPAMRLMERASPGFEQWASRHHR